MKITYNTKELKRALRAIKLVIGTRFTMPVLGHILIENNSMSATNMEEEIRIIYNNIHDSFPAVCVSFDTLETAVKAGFPEVSLLEKKAKYQVETGGNKLAITTMPAGDFPDFMSGEMTQNVYKLNVTELPLIQKAMVSCCDDESRYILKGVYFDELGVTGTNLKWLTHAEIRYKGPAFILPNHKINRKLASLFKEAEYFHILVYRNPDRDLENVRIALAGWCAGISGLTFVYDTMTREGNYPNYNMHIPDKYTELASIEPASLLKVAGLLKESGCNILKIGVDGCLEVLPHNKWDEFCIRINAYYFGKIMKFEPTQFKGNGPTGTMLFEGKGYKTAIMPLRRE